MNFNGYETKTTAWEDFSIADRFGESAIQETYKSLLNFCGTNYIYRTELTMILNWKIWQHYESNDLKIAKIYNDLWEKEDQWCCDNLKGKELDYFYRTTD